MTKLINFPNYEINEHGVVVNIKTGKTKKPYSSTQIELYRDTKKYKVSIALLLVNTFINKDIKLVESIGFKCRNLSIDNLYVKSEELLLQDCITTLFQHPRYKHIYVNNLGQVFSSKLSEQRSIVPTILYNIVGTENTDGYLEFGVSSTRTNYKLYRAIYECFTGKNIPEGMTIRWY